MGKSANTNRQMAQLPPGATELPQGGGFVGKRLRQRAANKQGARKPAARSQVGQGMAVPPMAPTTAPGATPAMDSSLAASQPTPINPPMMNGSPISEGLSRDMMLRKYRNSWRGGRGFPGLGRMENLPPDQGGNF